MIEWENIMDMATAGLSKLFTVLALASGIALCIVQVG